MLYDLLKLLQVPSFNAASSLPIFQRYLKRERERKQVRPEAIANLEAAIDILQTRAQVPLV
jgi:hypothetical protein